MFLAPQSDETKDLLNQLFASHTSLTAAAIAASSTYIASVDPAPAWLGPLQDALAPVQQAAITWQTVTGPQVIENLPQALITYNSHFQVAAENAATADQDTLLQDFQWLQRTAGSPLADAQRLATDIESYATEFGSQRPALETAIAGANESVQADRDDMARLADLISTLYQKISAQTTDVNNDWTSIGTTGAGLSFTLIKYAFTAATAGTAEIPFLDIAVALATITYDAVEVALENRDIADELGQITALKVELTVDAQQVAALQAIEESVQQLDLALVGSRDAPSFAPVWEDVNTDLGDAVAELSRPNFDTTVLREQIARAATAWQQASDMATNVQNSAAGMGERWTIDLANWPPSTQPAGK